MPEKTFSTLHSTKERPLPHHFGEVYHQGSAAPRLAWCLGFFEHQLIVFDIRVEEVIREIFPDSLSEERDERTNLWGLANTSARGFSTSWFGTSLASVFSEPVILRPEENFLWVAHEGTHNPLLIPNFHLHIVHQVKKAPGQGLGRDFCIAC